MFLQSGKVKASDTLTLKVQCVHRAHPYITKLLVGGWKEGVRPRFYIVVLKSVHLQLRDLISLKTMTIFNNTSADIKTKSADVLLKNFPRKLFFFEFGNPKVTVQKAKDRST